MVRITLGKDVVVSDPCYSIPTWCHTIINNVKPGNFMAFVKKVDIDGWGTRCSCLYVIHEKHLNRTLRWIEHGSSLGVDSGSLGVFDLKGYRNNNVPIPPGKGERIFGAKLGDEDYWYEMMCTRTLSEEQWGTYDTGVVTSSGVGDGSYNLGLAEYRGQVVGFLVDFQVEEEPYVDINWYMKEFWNVQE